MPRKLGNWLNAYAEYTDASEAPLSFDFWTGVSVISGALQRKVYIDEIKFKIFPNMYVFFVAPPGVATKSTTVGVGMRLLKQIDSINIGPSNMTWQGMIKGLENATQSYPISPSEVIDPLAIEYNTQSSIICQASELGTFLNMHDAELVSVLISLWDGEDGNFERWLATRDNVKIINPLIGIVGATTPAWMEQHFDAISIGNGLTSRIVFVYGEEKRRFIPYISDLVEEEGQKQLGESLVSDLREIAKLKGKFTITREARNLVGGWYEEHWTEPEEHLKDPRFAGYRARKFAHLHKLSMVLSASESDSLVITYEHVSKAFAFLGGIEADMLKVLNSIGRVSSSRQMDSLVETVRTKGRLTKSSLWRTVMNNMSPKEFSEGLDGLCQAHLIKIINGGNGVFYIYPNDEEKPEPVEENNGTEAAE